MHKIKSTLTLILLLVSSFLVPIFIQKVEAIRGEADVYIICLDGVPSSWVDNPAHVKDEAIDACMVKGTYIHRNVRLAHPVWEPYVPSQDPPPYYSAEPYVVTSWSHYKGIIVSLSEVIVVNAHGPYLPVSSGYTKEEWARAQLMV